MFEQTFWVEIINIIGSKNGHDRILELFLNFFDIK